MLTGTSARFEMSPALYTSIEQPRAQAFPPSLLLATLLMASIPLENATVLPQIGSVSRLLGLVAAGGALLDGVVALGFRRLHPAHAPLALFVLWSSWTWFWSINPQLTS